MARICSECGSPLKILGVGPLGDTIEVECPSCGMFDEVEQDGLGDGGLEFVDAMAIEMARED